jgi:hypothetical protein
MAVYGATPNEATDKLHELQKLSTADILTESITEETNVPLARKKQATLMYPARAVLLVRKPTTNPDGNLNTIDGQNYESSKIIVQLWTEDAPPGFSGFN